LNVISIFATTGSNSFRETQSITGSLTVTGQIIAQSINVQQVTSSIIYSSGSNNFGCDLNSRQTFTGSVNITGSLSSAGLITGQASIYQSNASGIISSNNWGVYNGGATDMNFGYNASGTFTVQNGTTKFQLAANGAACFACELTAKTIGTNDLLLNNLNYECANYVDGTRGSWLIQEGACDLFIINQVSCKKYKFNLIEIK
jgi:hypothetical protein